MKRGIYKALSSLGVVLLFAMALPQRAAADDDDDPPGRVARLNFTNGEVSFNPAGTDDWVSAVINRPITTGDKLWTDRGARAELHIGTAAIRLGEQTGFSFLNLTDNIVQIRMTEGVVAIQLRRLDSDETFEVDTPNLAFTLLRNGEYRLEVNEAGDATIITVHGGDGEVTGGGQAFAVHAEQRAVFTGADQLTSDLQELVGDDDFDNWCRDRDRREDHAESARYVSRDVVGYEDLDNYGDWRPVPQYGNVWVPRGVVVGWAPYRFGHWVWIAPWGWTWVDDAPWGFAPFHYGRWVSVGGYWGWVPGPVMVRPVYAPALVAWVGGPHFGVGISVGGGVGWFPLGPREVYVPTYHVSRAYVTRVNVTNTTVNNTYVTNVYNNYTVNRNVTNVTYVNQRTPGAVTVVRQETFTSAQPVGRNQVRFDEREAASAQVSASVGVAPLRRSVMGAGTDGGGIARPPAVVQSRTVVVKTAPPPQPVAFETQLKAVQANGGQPVSQRELHRGQPANDQQQTHNVRMAPPATTVVAPTPRNMPAPNQPPGRQEQPMHNDRPPSAQPTSRVSQNPVHSADSNANQPSGANNAGNATHADRQQNTAPQVNRNTQDQVKFQQKQEDLQRKQEQEHQQLEQRHQQEQQRLADQQSKAAAKQQQAQAKQEQKQGRTQSSGNDKAQHSEKQQAH